MSDVSRQVAISAICSACGKIDCDKMDKCEKLQLPPASCSEFPNSSDTISRAKAIDGKICIQRANGVEIYDDYVVPVEYLEQLPPAQPEKLTDIEQRIFLAAMSKEEKVCREVDKEPSDADCINLMRVCKSIERKVKGALWT